MQYLKPYTYYVNKPGSTKNLLWGSLALLVYTFVPGAGIIAVIVMLGYRSEVADDLKNDPDLADHRDFDVNRFVDYLARGVWPFLMQMLVGVVLSGLWILAFLAGIGAMLATNNEVVGLIVGGVLLIPFTLLGSMLVWPLELHTQLARGFRFGAACRFTGWFVRRVGGQLFFSLLAHTVLSMVVTTVGLLLCVVGLFPAIMITFMAQEHYMIQLYRVYLDEGGEPIGGPVEQAEMDED
jgi:hypothetical protein